jgi:uncharacterized repeat protein (TIGR01451 family)
LPNYVAAMDAATLAYPLCIDGDLLNNPYGCAGAEDIVGFIYTDANSNCIKDSGEQSINNIPIKQYDMNGNLLGQTYSFSNGIYNFADSLGTYTIVRDTIGKPYTFPCNYPGLDSTVTLSIANPLISNVNFDIACKLGIDVGVQAVTHYGWIFPGQQHHVKILAGDMSNWYYMNCAAGVSGLVQVTVTGNVTYNGIANGALTPNVAGNVFTYTIADFGNVNFESDFGLKFTADPMAQEGDTICVNVIVTPTLGDNNQSNNTYQYCYNVVNSFDPNSKEVYPVNVAPGYQDWLTYTIHFQNTGNAPAINIRLLDTLDMNLDLNTFEVINYSHANTITLNQNLLTFRFPNILLPDSTSNFDGSQGYVQYRIKPKANIVAGSQIQNKAFIYFDYNAPIVTNTTVNNFLTVVGASELPQASRLWLYPNPTNGIFNINSSAPIKTIEVYNVVGELILSQNNATSIDLTNQSKGIYFVKINGSVIKKLVKN